MCDKDSAHAFTPKNTDDIAHVNGDAHSIPAPTANGHHSESPEGGAGCAGVSLGEEEFEEQMRGCMVLVEVDVPHVALADGVHAR